MPGEKVRLKDQSKGTQLSNYSDKIPLTRPRNVSDTQWKKAIDVYNTAKKYGDKFPELTVAQAVLETGWFKSVPGSFNYFGQKATKSQTGNVARTHEVANNKSYGTSSKFRSYSSLDEAIQDRMRKWGSKYADAENVGQALYSIWHYDPEKGSGVGYATSTKYDKVIKSILGGMGVDFNLAPNSTQAPGTGNYSQTGITDMQIDATIPFKLETGEIANVPISTQLFEKEIEKEAVREEMIQSSAARQRLESEQQKRRDFLESWKMEYHTKNSMSTPQNQVSDPINNLQFNEIPVQEALPVLPSLFRTLE